VTDHRRVNERLVLALLRGADPREALPARGDDAAWEDLLALLRHHRVAALASCALAAFRERLPEHVAARLRAAEAHSALVNAAVARDGEHVLGGLLALDVPAAPLKGPWLAERLGVDAARRPTSDLDMLVPVAAMPAAARALADLGFHPDPAEPSGGWDGRQIELVATGERWWVRRIDLHLRLVAADGSHWMHRLWERAERRRWRGLDLWDLSPVDLVLAQAVHAAHHRWGHLCHLLDVALVVRAEGGRLDWDAVVAQAAEASITAAAGRSLALARELCAANVPPGVLRAMRPGGRRRGFADAVLARRGVIRPRARLLGGPYASLLDIAAGDGCGQRRAPAGSAPRRGLLRTAALVGVQAAVAMSSRTWTASSCTRAPG
jgi:hypothetical protein